MPNILPDLPLHEFGQGFGYAAGQGRIHAFHHDPANGLRAGVTHQHAPGIALFHLGLPNGRLQRRNGINQRLTGHIHVDQALGRNLHDRRQFGKRLTGIL